ncbi:MAG TPA: response regulator [Novosphingobium sp.]|nr:response regulator [Novosphingobium sp.]
MHFDALDILNEDPMKNDMSVLVVEDSFLVAASLEDALVEAGHRVTLARSVGEAEAAMEDGPYSAALLDFILPDGDSLALARRLHASGCKVAVVSGADRDMVPADGAIAALFPKPTDEGELLAWISTVSQPQQSRLA